MDLFALATLLIWYVLGLLGSLFLGILIRILVDKVRGVERKQPGFREKIQKLSKDLTRASAEVDKTLEEMETVRLEREEAIAGMETQLDDLSKRKDELQARVEMLKNVSLPAVEYFLEASRKSERRSARRDYMLFGAGVLTSTVVSLALKLIFNF